MTIDACTEGLAQLIDGGALAHRLRSSMRERAGALAGAGRRPGLAVVLVGDDAASAVYVRNKLKACEECGVQVLEPAALPGCAVFEMAASRAPSTPPATLGTAPPVHRPQDDGLEPNTRPPPEWDIGCIP